MKMWIEDDLERILPRKHSRAKHTIHKYRAFRGQSVYFQIGITDDNYVHGQLRLLPISSDFPVLENLKLFWQELVPLRYQTIQTPADWLETIAPGFVPDPLFPIPSNGEILVKLSPGEFRGIWGEVQIPRELEPGKYLITFVVYFQGNIVEELRFVIEVLDMELRTDNFPVVNWLDYTSLALYYGLKKDTSESECLKVVKSYIRCLAEHGQTMFGFPGFQRFPEKNEAEFYHVLIAKRGKQYEFDFTPLRKWIDLYKCCDTKYFEIPHLAGGIKDKEKKAPQIRGNIDGEQKLLWPADTFVFSEDYTDFIKAYIPAVVKELKLAGVFNDTYFHIADEPPTAILSEYQQFSGLLRSLEPNIKVMDALYSYQFYSSGAVDFPVTQLFDIPAFEKRGAVSWAYICNYPRATYPNRFLDYAIHRQRVLGFVFARYKIKGFLHWGANYWHDKGPSVTSTDVLINPFYVNDSNYWPEFYAGDPFILYPGDDFPIASLRLKVFKAALEDRRIIMTLLSDERCKPKVEQLVQETGSLNRMSNEPTDLRNARNLLFDYLEETP